MQEGGGGGIADCGSASGFSRLDQYICTLRVTEMGPEGREWEWRERRRAERRKRWDCIVEIKFSL